MLGSPATQRRLTWALALVLAAAAPAHAGVSIQGQLTVAAGVTDNVADAPTNPPPGQQGRDTDLLVTVSPGLILTIANARAIQRVSYFFGGLVYAKHPEADSYTNTFNWSGLFIPSKTTIATLSVALVQARQSAFNTSIDSQATAAPQLQLGYVTNQLSFTAIETLAWDITANWRVYESVGFLTSYLLDVSPPLLNGESVPIHLGVERSFVRDVVGLDLFASYSYFPAQIGAVTDGSGTVNPQGIVQPAETEVVASPQLRWRHDFNYFLSSHAELGMVAVFDPATPSNHLIEPSGGLGGSVTYKLLHLDVSYTHAVAPDLILHSNFVNESAQLRIGVLFGERSGFAGSAGAGYTYGRELDATNAVEAHTHFVGADVTLSYAPLKALSFFLRYQLLDQIGNPQDRAPLPSLYVNTVLLGLTALYPVESAADFPTNSLGSRADRADAAAITASKSTPK